MINITQIITVVAIFGIVVAGVVALMTLSPTANGSVVSAIIALAGTILAALIPLLAKVAKIGGQIEQVHVATNSMKDQLVAATAVASRAEGVAAERDRAALATGATGAAGAEGAAGRRGPAGAAGAAGPTGASPEKPWYQSRTIWASLGTILLGVLAMPEVRQIIPPAALPYLLALSGAVSLALRVMTTQPVTLGGETAQPQPPPAAAGTGGAS